MNRAVVDQPGGLMYLIGDDKMLETLNAIDEDFVDNMQKSGVIYVGDSLEDVAGQTGLDPAVLSEAAEKFNTAVDNGTDEEFGRTTFNGKVEGNHYVIAIGEAFYHLTFGGLVINTDAQVERADGNVIDGLYAAGYVVSGLESANHDSGPCLTTAVFFGKQAKTQPLPGDSFSCY